jgi:hypothetical protein
VASVPAGADILFTVYASSPWGTKYEDCKDQAAALHRRPISSPPINPADYVAFLQQLVGRYHLQVKYWQVENEVYSARDHLPSCPPVTWFWMGTKEEYADHVRLFAETVKGMDPGLTVLPAGVPFISPFALQDDEIFLEHVASATADVVDAVDVHLYGCVETVPARVSALRRELARFGLDLPLFATETGDIDTHCPTVPLLDSPEDLPEELALQSVNTVKRYVSSFGGGVEKVFALDLTAHENDLPYGHWSRMALTFDPQGLLPKPAFYAYQQMVAFLKGFTRAGGLSIEGTYLYGFAFDDRLPAGVAWADAPGTLDLSAYLPVSTIRLTPIVTALDATDAPIYPPETIVPVSAVPVSEVPVFLSIAP